MDIPRKKEPRFHGETTEKSHKQMSKIRGRDTSIEIVLRKALWKKGYRYRKNYEKLPGRPDIALTKYKIAIFCDGEFFHGKNWDEQKAKIDKGRNSDYWKKKIERNIERDQEKDVALRMRGWSVVHFWGGEIQKDIDGCIRIIEELIRDRIIEEVEDYDIQ